NAFRMGVERLVKKDPAGSLVHFQRAVAELPSYYEAYHQMGLAYMRLGQAAQAEQAFQKAIDLSQGRYPEALFGLASLLSNHERSGSPDARESPTGPGQCPEGTRHRSAQSLIPMDPYAPHVFRLGWRAPRFARYEGPELEPSSIDAAACAR